MQLKNKAQAKMNNQQQDQGFFKLPNRLAEAFAHLKISGTQWRLIWAILRKTYGWQKERDAISRNQFYDATGICERNIRKELRDLERRGIISKTAKSGRGHVCEYAIQKDFDLWDKEEKGVISPPFIDEGKGGHLTPEKGADSPGKGGKKVSEKGVISPSPSTKDIKDIIQKTINTEKMAEKRPVKSLKDISNSTIEELKNSLGSLERLKARLIKDGYDPAEVEKLKENA